MEQLLGNPLFLLIVGYVLAEFRRGRDGQVALGNSAERFDTRLAAVESWTRDHSSIHACVAKLTQKLEGVAETLDRLSRRFDRWDAPLELLPHQRVPRGGWQEDQRT